MSIAFGGTSSNNNSKKEHKQNMEHLATIFLYKFYT